MYRRSILGMAFVGVMSLLVACGGGGGDPATVPVEQVSESLSPDVARPAAVLAFGSASLQANVQQGSSVPITVEASSSDPAGFGGKLYAHLMDDAGVFMPIVRVAPLDDAKVAVTAYTRASIGVRRYQGTVKVQLCYDPDCAMLVSGESIALPYDITVAEKPLVAQLHYQSVATATVHRGGVVAKPAEVQVYNATQGWTATSAASWLKVFGGSGKGNGSFSVIYEPRTLEAGQYTAVVTVTGADGQKVELPFSLDVLPAAFVFNNRVSGDLVAEFTAVNGAPVLPQTLWFDMSNGVTSDWTATSSASWMHVSSVQGSTPAVVALQPDVTAGPLASGKHEADIVFSSQASGASKTLKASLTLIKPTLTAKTGIVLEFGGPRGRDLETSKSIALSLNTGSNQWPFALTNVPSTLSLSAMSGTVGEAGTRLDVAPVARNIKPGNTIARFTATAKVNGETVDRGLVALINADQRRLLASEWGIAFSSSPAGSTLARTINIRDNFEKGLTWEAVSDVPWLSVTPGGDTTGESKLNLAADAAALPMDVVSYGNVTVRTSTEGVEPAVIRVAVWRSASAPEAVNSVAPSGYMSSLVADKIRPYVYVGRLAAIDVYNVYTGALVKTLTASNAVISQMAVSADGSKLFVLDTVWRKVMEFDLLTMSFAKEWPYAGSSTSSLDIQAVKINGVDIVFLSNGQAYLDGRALSDFMVYSQAIGSLDGRRLYATLGFVEVDFSAMGGGTLFKSEWRWISSDTSGEDLAINSDGSRLYSAGRLSTGQGGCAGSDAVTGQPVVSMRTYTGTARNVEVTRDGRVLCAVDAPQTQTELFVFRPDGTLQKSLRLSGAGAQIGKRQLVVSPDGFMGAALSSDPKLFFFALPL